MVSFSFSHITCCDVYPSDSYKKNLANQIVFTFKNLELGEVSEVVMEQNKVDNTWRFNINVEFSQWNNDSPAACSIVDKVYQCDDDTLPSCAKIVYDDNKTWILWKLKDIPSMDYKYSVIWLDDDFSLTQDVKNKSDVSLETKDDFTKFYEDWADELNQLQICNYSDSFVEYRYDLMDMIYDSESHWSTRYGYIAYSYNDFIDYYGEDEGEMRWNSSIYTSFAYSCECGFMDNEKPPPVGCIFSNNISFLKFHLTACVNDESKFNALRKMLRKYIDVFNQYTIPSDDIADQPPQIKLRANLNENIYMLSCIHDFNYSNLSQEKEQNMIRMLQNLSEYCTIPDSEMYEWF